MLLVGCGSSGHGAASRPPAPTGGSVGGYANPVYDGDFPDPAVLRVGRTYYAYATQGGGKNIQTLTSPDLVHWRPGGDAMPDLAAWADGGYTWAPEVIDLDGSYVMYYVARGSKEGIQCIGRATAKGPGGPFTDSSSTPLICQTSLGGSIDPNPMRAADGSLYLYWKNDGNCCAKPVHLWGQRLSNDGAHLVGAPVALLTNDKAWQGNLVEAPEMVAHGGAYVLFYSANNYASANYGIGYGSCRGPLGPCVDASSRSLIPSNDAAAGPGHCFVLTTPAGASEMVYHAWPPDAVGSTSPGRQLWLEPITWRGNVPEVHPSQAAGQSVPK
ncbi:MAG: glycoside hydrolase family 43 protein [Actinomycetota bacterium]|nr:glycoside hydrolase family 43 protein [Actinomycetota bacterium]